MRFSALSGCVLLVASVLLSGCQSTSPQGAATPSKTADDKPPIPAEQWKFTLDADSEQRIEALSRFATGVSQEINEQSDAALEEFFRAGLADPRNERLVLDVARRLIQSRQLEKAGILLGKSAELAETNPNLLTLLALVYQEQDRFDEAIATNRKAIKKAPKLIGPYRGLTQLYLKKGRPADALAVMMEASKVEGAPVEFYVELGELFGAYARLKQDETEAIKPRIREALDRAYAAKTENTALLQKIADGYQFIKDYPKAIEIYMALLKNDPNTPGLRERLTGLFIQSGDKQKAVELLQALVRDNPTKNPEAYVMLASLLRGEKKFAEAADQMERFLIVRDNVQEAYYELVELHNLENKPEEALAVLDKAKKKFGQSFINHFYRAITYNRLKQYDKALEQLNAAEVLASATAPERLTHQFYFQLGSTYERNKDYPQAVKYFEKCLELEPDFAEALNYLGYMWAERGENLEKARSLIEKAVDQDPDNAAFLDSMAWVMFKLNRPEAALNWMLKAMKHTDEEDATLYDHLGDIYASLKNYGKAREAWEKSLKIEANVEVKRKLESAPK